jgi:tetratricopeptide (TPR) repeat protein
MALFNKKTRMSTAAILIAAALGVSALSSRAQAADDDELLNILGNGAAPSSQKAKTVEASELRKILKTPTAEQNIFLQFFDKGAFEKALYQWPTAFDDSAFGKTASGKALYSLLLFRNGIKITALESLLAIEKPDTISPALQKMWVEAAPVTDPTWSLIQITKWNPKWSDIFGASTEIRVRSRQIYGSDQIASLKELIKKTQADTPERAWLSWQLVLALSTGDDPGTAAKALAVLMKAPHNPVSQDLMTVTAARLLYQNGFLDAAIKYYGQVSKSSDYWFDAQEEEGWSYIRKGEPQNTIALTKSLTLPEFTSQIGPEPLFLHSLAELKVCDYPAVVTTLNNFRDRFKTRAASLMAISDQGDNKDVDAYIARAKTETMTLKKLGKEAKVLPRFVTRDEVLSQAIATQVALENEAKTAGNLYARSLSGGTGQVGFQARLEEFRKAVDSRALEARGTTYSRVKTLAAEEVNEIAQILQKLHIVEAEVLEQISMSSRVSLATANDKASVKTGTTGSHAKDRVVFPAEQETWFDELANYKVDIKKGCQSAKR